jgi:hypothetical protein
MASLAFPSFQAPPLPAGMMTAHEFSRISYKVHASSSSGDSNTEKPYWTVCAVQRAVHTRAIGSADPAFSVWQKDSFEFKDRLANSVISQDLFLETMAMNNTTFDLGLPSPH